MTGDSAQSVVVTSLTVTALLVAISEGGQGNIDAVRIGVGFTFTTVGLALVAEIAPTFAAAFSVLILTGTVLLNKNVAGLISSVGKRVAPTSP